MGVKMCEERDESPALVLLFSTPRLVLFSSFSCSSVFIGQNLYLYLYIHI